MINRSFVSFDPLPINATTDDSLFSGVNCLQNICALGRDVGGGGRNVSFVDFCELGSCLLSKYVLFGDRYRNKEDGAVGRRYYGTMEMVVAGVDTEDMQDDKDFQRKEKEYGGISNTWRSRGHSKNKAPW